MGETDDENQPYVYNIDEASLKKAKAELNEDPKNTQGAIDEFRKWISQQPWLKTPTDSTFLLSYLRNKKFSLVLARETLTNYWTARTEHPEWFSKIDMLDPIISKYIDSGAFLILPKPDKDGRVIFISRAGKLTPGKDFDMDPLMKYAGALIDYMQMNEPAQINGFVFIEDMTGITMSHLTHMGKENMSKSMKIYIKAYPLRYKQIHYYNIGPVFEAMFALMKPLMPTKLKNRITLHGNSLVTLYDHIDKSVLPTEYLPDDYTGPNVGSLVDVAKDLKVKLQSAEVRDHILKLSSGDYCVDLKTKPKEGQMPQESFRKLNVE